MLGGHQSGDDKKLGAKTAHDCTKGDGWDKKSSRYLAVVCDYQKQSSDNKGYQKDIPNSLSFEDHFGQMVTG